MVELADIIETNEIASPLTPGTDNTPKIDRLLSYFSSWNDG